MTEDHNRVVWNAIAARGDSPYARAVTPPALSAARRGEWHIMLTDTRPMPRSWLLDPRGLDILCLASGGQQGPILAAAGAKVTVFNLSKGQLAFNRAVANREGVNFRVVRGSMTDLSEFSADAFDAIVHPVSNLFVPDVRSVWHKAYRVLRPGRRLLAGFLNSSMYIFELYHLDERKRLRVRYTLPYADETHLPPERLEVHRREGWALEFSHSLTEQIAGQTGAGFSITRPVRGFPRR